MRQPRAKAFAGLFAIILLGLTASAIAFLTTWIMLESSRAVRDVTDAQLRTLLRAQADAVVRGEPKPLLLPEQLSEAGYIVGFSEVAVTGPNARATTLFAAKGRRKLTERLVIESGKATEARLNP